jgi:lipopolysaccharide/colanic/teichoic acid biosynthesis glycosyltransferase
VIVLIAIIVRFSLGSPVLFRQRRPGLNTTAFTMLKFRTMRDDRNEAGELLSDEYRLPPLGKFLRSTSLDELPELWNVLTGEMSLVGPRPLLPGYIPLYSKQQLRRHDVKPGITGWAQVNGRNAISWEEKFVLDIWYVENHSFWLDIKILFLTLWSVVARKDVSAAGHATMPEFTGKSSDKGAM